MEEHVHCHAGKAVLGRLLPECPMQSTQKWAGLLTSGLLAVSLSDETPREISRKKKKNKKGEGGREERQLRKWGVVVFQCTINCQGYFGREKKKRPDCACLKLLYFCPECRGNDGIK